MNELIVRISRTVGPTCTLGGLRRGRLRVQQKIPRAQRMQSSTEGNRMDHMILATGVIEMLIESDL